MNRYVMVAIGGTGMRIAQSLVMLAASGALSDLAGTDDYKLEIKMVDLDVVPGGDKDELIELISNYNKAIKNYKPEENDSWKPHPIHVEPGEANLFVPQDQILGKKLEEILETEAGKDAKMLLRALYGRSERETMTLDRGCNGKPRIGSLLFATEFVNQKEFWDSIISRRPSNGGDFRIMFAGSVFGGTGASGVPTLARKFGENIDDHVKDVFGHIGITLMLPYFSYQKTITDPVDPDLFPLQSQMAVKYYGDSNAMQDFEELEYIQVVGDDIETMLKPQKDSDAKLEEFAFKQVLSCFSTDKDGCVSKGQDNPSMPAELMAALNICRFFTNRTNKNATEISSKNTEKLQKNDRIRSFNFFSESIPMEEYVGRLVRLFLMLHVYLPGRRGQDSNGKANYEYQPPLGISMMFGNLQQYLDAIAIGDAFFNDLFIWLIEMSAHGMKECLRLESNIKKTIDNAREGATDFDLYNIKIREMLRGLNNMMPGDFLHTILNVCARPTNRGHIA